MLRTLTNSPILGASSLQQYIQGEESRRSSRQLLCHGRQSRHELRQPLLGLHSAQKCDRPPHVHLLVVHHSGRSVPMPMPATASVPCAHTIIHFFDQTRWSRTFRIVQVKFLRSKRGMAAVAWLSCWSCFCTGPAYTVCETVSPFPSATLLAAAVAIDNVHLHLLPRPGFDLEGLVISDDPAFSAEPMIRAQEVSAAIRLRSLLRGRLEIATLSATEPSINLVRNSQGRWNLASLIERNAQIPAAPTAKARLRTPPGVSLSRSQRRPHQFQAGTNEEVFRADGCRRGTLAGFGKFLGRAHKGRARAHGFQSHRHRTAPDQRHLAARCELARSRRCRSPCNGKKDNWDRSPNC